MNMPRKLSTLEVSKLDKLRKTNLEQPLNIALMVVTEDVFMFPKVIFSKFKQYKNIQYMVVT